MMKDETEVIGEETTSQDAVNDVAMQSAVKADGRDWKGRILLVLALGAPIVALGAAVGSGWGLWDFRPAFTVLMGTVIAAVAVLLLAMLFKWMNKRSGAPASRLLHWGSVLLALLYLGWIGNIALKGRSVPAIHDVSTDLADPPVFKTLTLREDNWDSIPGEGDSAMQGLNPQQRWRKLHQEAYGDIRSVGVDMPVQQVIEKAQRLADDRGWDVVSVQVAEGKLEATDTSALFRFKDDVVIRVRPTESGGGSIVDMRSVSRVGISDLGVNAARVRTFLADLSGTVTAG